MSRPNSRAAGNVTAEEEGNGEEGAPNKSTPFPLLQAHSQVFQLNYEDYDEKRENQTTVRVSEMRRNKREKNPEFGGAGNCAICAKTKSAQDARTIVMQSFNYISTFRKHVTTVQPTGEPSTPFSQSLQLGRT